MRAWLVVFFLNVSPVIDQPPVKSVPFLKEGQGIGWKPLLSYPFKIFFCNQFLNFMFILQFILCNIQCQMIYNSMNVFLFLSRMLWAFNDDLITLWWSQNNLWFDFKRFLITLSLVSIKELCTLLLYFLFSMKLYFLWYMYYDSRPLHIKGDPNKQQEI